jgi:peptide/nickel transport system substrate-binding protein
VNLKLPTKIEIVSIIASLSKKEKIFFAVFLVIFIFSTLGILNKINKSFMVSVPLRGGSITEGIAGVPRFINPILASSPVDQSLTTLIYSGLMRKTSEGELIPDLALKYEMSENGLMYTFTLKEKLQFHNGKPITADDVVFTIEQIKDPTTKSPFQANWDSIEIKKIDEKTVQFLLRQPYSSFLENTTIGIVPIDLWASSLVELNEANTNPIGSGPFMIDSVQKQSSGIIENYKLKSFKKFALGEPYIKEMNLNFYQNEDNLVSALTNGEVDQISSLSPSNAEILKQKKYNIDSSVLPRIFGLFFNQNKNQIFLDKSVISAINEIIDKDRIVKDVLLSYGTMIDSPIPKSILGQEKVLEMTTQTKEEKMEKAKNILAKAGWKIGEEGFLEKTTTENKKKTTTKLEFSIYTGSAPELTKTAELIKEDLNSLGMKVDVKTSDTGNLNQDTIRPRKYEALLFGQIVNHESDLFAFWHSSQRNDPGLNVAMYTSAKVDKILEDAFVTLDEENRTKKYLQFSEEIKKDMPAVFLYSPAFIYTVSPNLKNYKMDNITSPKDRYFNVYKWYIKTESVWKIFNK